MRVLIADDSNVSRMVLARMVESWGYEVVMAADGDEAYRELTKPDPPRLAVVDWMMPGMDGLELCRRLRAQPRPQYTYLYLLTARNGTRDLLAGLDAGADDYLTKPVAPEDLRARLSNGQRLLQVQEELGKAREALWKKRSQPGGSSFPGAIHRGDPDRG